MSLVFSFLVELLIIFQRTHLQVAGRGKLYRFRGYWGNNIPRLDLKLTYDGLPRGNQDLGRSGNCKWEAALAKLAIGGDEVNR